MLIGFVIGVVIGFIVALFFGSKVVTAIKNLEQTIHERGVAIESKIGILSSPPAK